MSFFNFILFLYFILEIVSESNDSSSETNNNINEEFMKSLNLSLHLHTILTYLFNRSDICTDDLSKNYNNISSLEELYEYSSKGFLDMSSFSSCIKNDSNNFFSFYPNLTKEARNDIAHLKGNLDQHLWIFGVCLKTVNCSEEKITQIFYSVNELFNLTFQLYNHSNVIVKDFKKTKSEIASTKNIILNLIPLFFLFIQIIFMIIKIIPTKLFICCLKRKYLRVSEKGESLKNVDNLLNSDSLARQLTLKIRKCFSISEILDDLVFSRKNDLFKDEDMTYIKGVRTLGLIFFIFGFNFIIMYNYPLCLSEKDKREEYMKDSRTSFLVISLRLGPALLLSASGYSLCYKFLNFLDRKLVNFAPENNEQNSNSNIDNSQNKDLQKNEDNNNTDKIAEKIINKNTSMSSSEQNSSNDDYYENTFGIKFYNEDVAKTELNKLFKGQKINEKVLLSQISTDQIPYYIYFNFVFRQLHKLVFTALGILTFRRSIPILLMVYGGTPLMHYIYETFFNKLGTTFPNYLYFGNFVDLFSNNDGFLMMQLYCIPVSEFNYFIVCSILIFICYKKKLRLDIILSLLIFIDMAFKIAYIVPEIQERNPGIFYTDSPYQRFFLNPIFNFDFFLIGMMFGIMNYVVQNGMVKKESLINERPFVKIPLSLLKLSDYTKNKNFIHFIIIVILMIFFLIIVPILFSQNFEDIIESESPPIYFVIFSLIDIELFIYCFHFVLMSCYVSGRNLFFKIFNAHISSYGVKLSFWVIMGVPTLTYLLIYSNEANINLSFFMVLVYASITLINAVVIGLVYFLFLEMPYKKLIKLYFNISEEINKLYLEDECDDNEKDDIGMNELSEKDLIGENNDEKTKLKEEDDVEDDI